MEDSSMAYYVYILSNQAGTVLYTGTARDLLRRVWQHKQKLIPGFTSCYNVTRLVYWEQGDDVMAVIEREKQVKGGSRARKLDLIRQQNPHWLDLYDDLISGPEIATPSATSRNAGRTARRGSSLIRKQ
jgi:putative endonuclease